MSGVSRVSRAEGPVTWRTNFLRQAQNCRVQLHHSHFDSRAANTKGLMFGDLPPVFEFNLAVWTIWSVVEKNVHRHEGSAGLAQILTCLSHAELAL